jgi:bacteriorhodopsin
MTTNDHEVTYYVSIVLQLMSLGLAAAAFSIKNNVKGPERILFEALIVESSVNVFQFGWYVTMYFLSGFSAKKPLITLNRYWDWIFTTPCMLVSLVATTEYVNAASQNLAELFGNNGFVLACALVSNAVMLVFGFVAEWFYPKKGLKKKVTRRVLVSLGFVPLIVTFGLLVYRFAQTDAYVLLLYGLVFCVWSMYGAVALFVSESRESAWYNVLDCVSKNIAGFVLAFVVLI